MGDMIDNFRHNVEKSQLLDQMDKMYTEKEVRELCQASMRNGVMNKTYPFKLRNEPFIVFNTWWEQNKKK